LVSVNALVSLNAHSRISPPAEAIRQKRRAEKKLPEIARWKVAGGEDGVCLRYEYEWLKPLRSSVDSIADFGCWATTDAQTPSEPYSLLWTLEATRVVVIDKNPEYIRNAQAWLDFTRARHSYFEDYDLKFIVGDLTDRIDALNECDFDLSYCDRVLYNMYPNLEELQNSINEMARVVKPGGWVIAIEPKMGVEYEFDGKALVPNPLNDPKNASQFFEAANLDRAYLDGAPDFSYCYRKPPD
jgi:SAM-dependent methyltransferase